MNTTKHKNGFKRISVLVDKQIHAEALEMGFRGEISDICNRALIEAVRGIEVVKSKAQLYKEKEAEQEREKKRWVTKFLEMSKSIFLPECDTQLQFWIKKTHMSVEDLKNLWRASNGEIDN